LIDDHENELAAMPPGHLGQNDRHRGGVHSQQHQTDHVAIVRADGAEGIRVCVPNVRREPGTTGLRPSSGTVFPVGRNALRPGTSRESEGTVPPA
jgi:hypothetical protein